MCKQVVIVHRCMHRNPHEVQLCSRARKLIRKYGGCTGWMTLLFSGAEVPTSCGNIRGIKIEPGTDCRECRRRNFMDRNPPSLPPRPLGASDEDLRHQVSMEFAERRRQAKLRAKVPPPISSQESGDDHPSSWPYQVEDGRPPVPPKDSRHVQQSRRHVAPPARPIEPSRSPQRRHKQRRQPSPQELPPVSTGTREKVSSRSRYPHSVSQRGSHSLRPSPARDPFSMQCSALAKSEATEDRIAAVRPKTRPAPTSSEGEPISLRAAYLRDEPLARRPQESGQHRGDAPSQKRSKTTSRTQRNSRGMTDSDFQTSQRAKERVHTARRDPTRGPVALAYEKAQSEMEVDRQGAAAPLHSTSGRAPLPARQVNIRGGGSSSASGASRSGRSATVKKLPPYARPGGQEPRARTPPEVLDLGTRLAKGAMEAVGIIPSPTRSSSSSFFCVDAKCVDGR